jgi:tyrosinase
MAISRREILLQGSVIGAGLIATNMKGMEALAQGQPPLRQSLGNLQLNDPILQAWRDGVAQLKAKPATDKISWASFAALHGNVTSFNECPHGNWYFLPWHRAFILMYERTVRQLTGHNDFALPYWDWTNNRQLPAAFTQPTINGGSNSLFEPQRDASPTDSLGDEIVGQAVINTILGQTDYETFGTSRPSRNGRAQDSLDQSWINCQSCGVSGTLEATPHNLVHNFVGGLMGSSQSALDPIFLMHHCNIDRIWTVWNAAPLNNQNSSDLLWTDMIFQQNYYNPDGSFYSPKVSDLVTPETLGYTYGLPPPAGPAVAARPAAVMALSEKLKMLFATPNLRGAAGVKTFTAQNAENATATAEKPLDIPIEVDRNLMSAVARHPSPSSGNELLNFNAVQEERASGTRALALVRDIAVVQHKNTLYRVFIDCDYLSQATPVADPHYVGTFGIFGNPGEHAGHGSQPAVFPSILVDLTATIKRVYGSAAEHSGRIRVQILPTPIRPSAGPAGTAAPSHIEVVFVSP